MAGAVVALGRISGRACCQTPRPRDAARAAAHRRDRRDRSRWSRRAHAPDPEIAGHQRLDGGDRRAPRLSRLLDRNPRVHGRLRGSDRAGRALLPRGHLQTLDARSPRGSAGDRVRRADPAVDRRLQLHRVCTNGNRARAQSLSAWAGGDRHRPHLPVRRPRLEARADRLWPAVHAALLSARAARGEGRPVGHEGRGAGSQASRRLRSRGAAPVRGSSTRSRRCSSSAPTRCICSTAWAAPTTISSCWR